MMRSMRLCNCGGLGSCENRREYRLYPVLDVIENVPSWQECGEHLMDLIFASDLIHSL